MLICVSFLLTAQIVNGQSWQKVGAAGSPGGVIYAMTTYGGNLVFSGDNNGTGPGYVYQYNGTTVSQFTAQSYALSTGPYCFALTVYNGVLYMGGTFSSASGSTSCANVAYWNTGTSKWSPLAAGGTSGGTNNYGVLAMTVWNNKLVVGGDFTKVNGGLTTANYVATFDGTTWGTLSGLNGDVMALTVWNGNLYAGGSFTSPGTGIAEWNGSSWVALSGGSISGSNGTSGNPTTVQALAAVNGSPGYLCLGGDFTKAGTVSAANIATWNGTSYSAMGTGMTVNNGDGADVYGLLSNNGDILAVGDFQKAGGTTVNFVAYWNGSWSAMASGFNSDAHSLWIWNSDLFAGGIMNNFPTQPYIEQWTSNTILPIKLLSFNAVYNNDAESVDIGWSTATETNNKEFTVEKSIDGENWNAIEEVPGAGNSSVERDYAATDESPFGGISYYRLKQTDYDGNSTYSDVQTVNIDASFNKLAVIPNPAYNNVTISFGASSSGVAIINLYDCTGRLVNTTQINTVKGVNATEINVSGYNSGVYILTVSTQQKQYTSKILIGR